MNRKQSPIVMHLICFVGWNAQTAVGGFQFPRLPNSIWIVQLCYVLLDGMLKLQWGFSFPKWEMCEQCWFLIVMHLICFVGWNAQTAVGGFQFPRLPNSIWIVQLCYVLLDGMLKLQWGFSFPKWEMCEK